MLYNFEDLINKFNARDYNINRDYKRFSNLNKFKLIILQNHTNSY